MATLLDPTTNRQVYTGPAGEAGSATYKEMYDFAKANGIDPNTITSSSIGGVFAYYIPGKFIQQGNVAALKTLGGSAGGGATSNVLIDPSTNRPAYTGPAGEAGSATYKEMADFAKANGIDPSLIQPSNVGGHTAYYIPGKFVQAGNVSALKTAGLFGDTSTEKDKEDNATENANAFATIKEALNKYGLGSLADWAWPLAQQGYSVAYVLQQLRDRPEFKARFPAIEIREKNGLTPLSPADYVALESQYDTAIHQTGMTGLFDRNDLYTKWIGGDVSASEVHDRAQAAYQAAMGEPLDVRAELVRMYGPDASGVATAYFLDPTNSLPKIQQRLRSGEIAGGSSRSGYGLLTREEAESLADLGISGQQAQAGFGDLAQKQELFGALPGENVSTIGRSSQIAAEFGSNTAAQQEIEQRAASRKAQVNSGARYGIGSGGVTGLGSAAG